MEGSKSSAGFGSKTIIDPVCGMDVALGKAPFVVHYQGTGYYFCAEACRHTFEKDPDKYLGCSPVKRKGIWGRYLDRLNKATGGKSLKCH